MRQLQRLSAAKVRTLSEPGQYSDGNGLTLRVEPTGSKRWVQRVTLHGKRHNIGLGGFPAVSLADAREMAAANQLAIKQGKDPLADKYQAAAELKRSKIATFSAAARQVVDLNRPTWSNAKHAAQWESTLTTYAFPLLGQKPVNELTPSDILSVLTPVWTTKAETASRVRQRMETVLDWTVAQGWRSDNPAGRAITRVLPRQNRRVTHHPALPYSEVPAALSRIRESSSDQATRLAFEFLVLTAARSREVRLAFWTEVDWKQKVWAIPAERMKARREHKVPLSQRALEVVVEARQLGGEENELIFPSFNKARPLSDMTFTTLLRRLEIPAVPHGFRSSFRDWCSEEMGEGYEIAAEMALAHNVGTATRRAYARSNLLDQRRVLMEAWASYVVGSEPALFAGKVQ